MKQITLGSDTSTVAGLCPGRLLLVWGLYGCAMALLWRLAAPSWAGQAALWTVGALSGLLLAAKEI